jgi:alanine racemase
MRSWVEISLGQIRANYRAVRAVVGAKVDVMAVVKADAYRHGAPEVARALEAEGVSAGRLESWKKARTCDARASAHESW